MFIVGIDLAWGERNRDGVCLVRVQSRHAAVVRIDHTHGDDELLNWLETHVGLAPALVLIDAPLVCPNATGSRPVDKLVSAAFRAQHAGCYPANLAKCPRPVRLAKRLEQLGYAIGWEPERTPRLIMEVYPHPALVRLLNLNCIVKYKRSPVRRRRGEFRRLQRLLESSVAERFPKLRRDALMSGLLNVPWTKSAEDRLDAFICALIGYHHYLHGGRRSEIFGDLKTGFILVPRA